MPAFFEPARIHPLWGVRLELLVFVFACGVLELGALRWTRRGTYDPRLIVSTTAMWLVEQGGRLATLPLRLAVFAALFALGPRPDALGPAGWLLAVVAVDALYYAKHRLLHESELGWALHAVHHSSDDLNLMAAMRLGWVQRLLDDFFYLPLALFVPPLPLLLAIEVVHMTVFWCHTRMIGRLSWLDGWLNTPSNHRVHHDANRATSGHNYGAVLIVWDRLFGTYQPEARHDAGDTARRYGLDTGPVGFDPLRIQLGPLARYVRARMASLANRAVRARRGR